MSRVGETGVGEMGIGEMGVGEMGVGETGPNQKDIISSDFISVVNLLPWLKTRKNVSNDVTQCKPKHHHRGTLQGAVLPILYKNIVQLH